MEQMTRICMNIEHLNKKESLLELLRRENHMVMTCCGGNGTCGKCSVRFLTKAPEASQEDLHFFSAEQLKQGYRLACTAYPIGEIEVEFQEKEAEMRILNHGRSMEKLVSSRKETTYVIAIDLGTTTLAFELIDENTGEVILSETGINHGRSYGADVLSRIKSAEAGKNKDIQQIMREDILIGIKKLMNRSKVEAKKLTRVLIAGNTTMEHFLLGYETRTLGSYPFQPVSLEWQKRDFKSILDSNLLNANVFIFPGISAFVGADIVSGLYDCEMGKSDGINVFVDLGTNGEMAIGNKERILATSVAAGPAFEGGNISCGVPGVTGAISNVRIEQERCHYQTIGNRVPIGICGSGVLELVSELRKNQIVDETGAFLTKYQEKGYPIASGIRFLQRDVREIQLAKAAVRAGLEMLLSQYGAEWSEIEHVYLAGGFGYELDVEQAVCLGMFPKEAQKKICAVGNTSLSGLRRFAFTADGESEIDHIRKITFEINLATLEQFEETYLRYLNFS